MTYLAVSISGDDAAAVCARMDRAKQGGADLVELRLDGLVALNAQTVQMLLRRADELGLRVLATCRDPAEGGLRDHPLDLRIEMLCEAARHGALFIDCEYANYRRGAARGPLMEALGKAPQCRLILSVHDFERPLADPRAVLREIRQSCPEAIPKLAYRADHICDSLDALRLVSRVSPGEIIICMGEAGAITRLLAGRFGALLTYASLDDETATAPGQMSLATMQDLYRFNAIGPGTRLFGVIGDPVAHSMSPAIFNACFDAAGVDAVYVPLRVTGGVEGFAAFMDRIVTGGAGHTADWGGFSVTIPHKAHALEYLRACDGHVEPGAARIGAVNTLKIEAGGLVSGYNTDRAGAMDALSSVMGIQPHELAGKPIAIVGAGGVARAVVSGLKDVDAAVTIYNRTLEKAQTLAAEFNAQSAPLDALGKARPAILINCTNLGMYPNTDTSAVPATVLHKGLTVFDTVYNPMETRLLREAAAAGARCVNGVEMFVRQAAAQYRLWFGANPDIDLIRGVVLARLGS